MRRKGAFTLVELLIVVGIIGLLVTLIMPSLGRARELAKKTVCAAQLNSYARVLRIFVEDHGHYPPMGTVGPPGFPKFYGLMQEMRIEPPRKYSWGWDYSTWELDDVWEKAFCPSMDPVKVVGQADRMWVKGLSPAYKPSLHRAAAGYQWNVTLRGAGMRTVKFSSGRWPAEPWEPQGDWWRWDNTMWIDFILNLATPGVYVCQAVSPDEIKQPASVAEAFDGWDHESIPGLNWADSGLNGAWSWENLVPGWHVGPQSEHCNGWALLNGRRHPSSPNVMYADGHVAADATRDVPLNEVGGLPGGASWEGAYVKSWEDFDHTFGTMRHVVPRMSFSKIP